jgi:hypothetical protein
MLYQTLSLRVLNSWKGPHQIGETVNLTVSVVEFCGGLGCVMPFKVGDITLVLSPTRTSFFDPGCWTHDGMVINGVLSLPAMVRPE